MRLVSNLLSLSSQLSGPLFSLNKRGTGKNLSESLLLQLPFFPSFGTLYNFLVKIFVDCPQEVVRWVPQVWTWEATFSVISVDGCIVLLPMLDVDGGAAMPPRGRARGTPPPVAWCGREKKVAAAIRWRQPLGVGLVLLPMKPPVLPGRPGMPC